MSIAGIDFSTRFVDVVLLDEDSDAATWHRFELSGQDAWERARDAGTSVPNRSSSFWDDALAVGIEDPRGYNAGSLYRVQGAILACIPWGRLVQPWIPSKWRTTVGLPGNASKADVAAFVNAHFFLSNLGGVGYIDWPQDAKDAYCIALATRTVLERVAA